MDALSKFIWVFISSTLPFVLWEPWQIALQVVVLFLIAFSFSFKNLGNLMQTWRLFCLLGAAIMFFHLWTRHQGTELWRLGVLAIHTDGVHFGLLYGLRLMAIMSSSYIFVRTTNPRHLVVALVQLGVPYRYAWMIFLSLLSLPVFEVEITTVREAQLVRGVRPGTNRLQERLEMTRRYILPLLVSALRRVETIAIAMDSRAFGAFPQRTFIDQFRWSRSGLILVGAWLFVFLGLLFLRLRQIAGE
jgi:energy-coupling factor transport system permease protein